MALTDTAIRALKPAAAAYKRADSDGLYLQITPAGGKLWRFKYRHHGVERKLSLGAYPDVSLADARRSRDEARKLLAAGQDPATAKQREKAARKLAAANTFGAVAREYIDKAVREQKAPATIAKLNWAMNWWEPAIGHRPISEIEPFELLEVLRRQEAEGLLETARRTRAFASRVFRYAVVTTRAKHDPAAVLVGAVAAPRPKHHAAIVEPGRLGELLRAIDSYWGAPLTRLALSLAPHLFLRPGELRQAEWSEFDFGACVWRVPGRRTKKRREHVTPLSRQAMALLMAARELSGDSRFVFPAQGKPGRTLSENTLNAAMRRMGFSGDEVTAHGFRATASTLLNEAGQWHPDAIERALAHADKDAIRGIYHRGQHWDERVRMAQWWSDKLDALRDGAKLIELPRRDRA